MPKSMSRANHPTFLALLYFSISMFILALVFAAQSYIQYQADQRIDQALTQAASDIRYYDEVLTLSVHLFGHTGESFWEERYVDAVPRLAFALEQAKALDPSARANLDAVESANLRLLKLETQAFEQIRAGDINSAADILGSTAYMQDKATYSAGLQKFTAELDVAKGVQVAAMIRQQLAATIMIILIFAVIVGLVMIAYRVLGKKLDLENLLNSISQKLLSPANDDLDLVLQDVLMKMAHYSHAHQIYLTLDSDHLNPHIWTYQTEQGSNISFNTLNQSIPLGPNNLLFVARIKRIPGSISPEMQQLLDLGITSYLGLSKQFDATRTLKCEFYRSQKALAWQGSDIPLIESILDLIKQSLQQREHRERLFELATIDALTGLFNRRYFLESFERELAKHKRSGTPATLAMIDLDHFKRINDDLGHEAGDIALKIFAQVALSCTRQTDLIGRIGGEEFAWLIDQACGTEAIPIAERMRQAIANKLIELPASRFNLTVSIGLYQIPFGDETVDQLLKQADHALYQAKNLGRNRTQLLT
ncbi:MAG: GGDEF domain-containing protein [Eubacteriales bacterium]|nr:GGDEF domain-containing protein [Eubacteriales bacterium]